MSNLTYIGNTNFRGKVKKFGIKPDDRRRHFYVIGKTGMGKSQLLENMAIQDIQNGNGMAFIDPHGDVAEALLEYIPKERIKDVIYFNPSDTDYPIAFNVMESVDADKQHLVVAGLMGVFKKIWPDVWSARMEYILSNTLLALLDYPDATLLGVNWMFSDPEFRGKVISHIKDPVVKNFWTKEYASYNQRYEVEATAAIQNKIGQFISNPLIRNIIGQPKSTFDIRKAMDEKKIVLLNLSKGRVGEDNSRLLGAMLVTKIYLAAMSRVDTAEEERKDFYLYVDEFQNFATEAFVNILSEARKYRLCLVLAHQYVAQMEDHVRDAVFGNMGTMVSFRIGAEDGEAMEKEFAPVFLGEDFVNLPKYNIYLKLMIDGLAGQAFSASTLPPWTKQEQTFVREIIDSSRKTYAHHRSEVDQRIKEWADNFKAPPPAAAGKSPTGTDLYDAKCSKCGKDFKVAFTPDPKRPLYCKTCLKKVMEGKEKKDSNFMSLSNLPNSKMSFVAPRGEKKEKKRTTNEVDTEELKGIIEKAFEDQDDRPDDTSGGILEEGEVIKF